MRVTIPTDGMVLTEDTVFAPGTYQLPKGIQLARDGISLDGNGAHLIGDQRSGTGLRVLGRAGITIKGLQISDYRYGVHAQKCEGLTIVGCRVSGTEETAHNTDFLNVWLPAGQAYGGGVFLRGVTSSVIENNDFSHQMNGLMAYHCGKLTVRNNIANYCSGWGFHLYDTSDSLYENNYADFCSRYHPRGDRHGHMGADAAGFLIVYKSCRNVFRKNYARLGGDGFFLAGLSEKLERVGCDENLFEQNDGSYSPNIAFEATFSKGNVFRDNIADHCNYGFWLGFSRENVIEGNTIRFARAAGIATENGVGMKVRGNTFSRSTHGILLWSKYVPVFEKAVPENDTSRDWVIEKNTFSQNQVAIRIAADQDHGVLAYSPDGACPTPTGHVIRNNQFSSNHSGVEVAGAQGTDVAGNKWDDVRDVEIE